MALALATREHTGKSGKTYTQWFDGAGRMVGCGCDEAKAVHVEKYNFKPCAHMIAHNNRPQYEGCDFCGCNHKSWNCPF